MSYQSSYVALAQVGKLARRPEPVTAIDRYKEIIGLANRSAHYLREHDRARVRELMDRLAQSQEQMVEVIELENIVKLSVALQWEAAMETLWDERWLRIGLMPRADEFVPAREQLEYAIALDEAFYVLREAVAKKMFGLRNKQLPAD